jgi:hypothetical protein
VAIARLLKPGVTKRCRLSWLNNSALLYAPKCAGRGCCRVPGSQPMNTAVHRSPNKLRRSNSIFNLWLKLRQMGTLGEHMRGVLPWLVRWARHAGTIDFLSCLGCSATWAGSKSCWVACLCVSSYIWYQVFLFKETTTIEKLLDPDTKA